MAEYIDREKIFPNGVFYVSAENPESSLNELINRICNLPTADVVPKSEVDRLNAVMKQMDEQRAYTINMLGESLEKAKAEVEELKSDLVFWKQERFNLFQRLECYEMARQKVAREIFEEIEKVTPKDFTKKSQDFEFGYRIAIQEIIAELKKKYVESEKC